MKDQLKKAIELSKRTGDRLMVYDLSESHEPYIVMAIDDYEKIVTKSSLEDSNSLTDSELTDKINRDIAVWKEDQVLEKEEIIKDQSDNDNEPVYEKVGGKEDDAEVDVDIDKEDGESEDNTSKSGWNIPPSRRKNINI